MKTINLDCCTRRMIEPIIAECQEIYTHVEFISWCGGVLTLAYLQ